MLGRWRTDGKDASKYNLNINDDGILTFNSDGYPAEDDKEGFEYKKEDNTDETEVDPKNNQTPPPVVQPGGNRFEKVEEVDLSASAAPNFSGLNLTDQSREVLNILDQLNELDLKEESFSR